MRDRARRAAAGDVGQRRQVVIVAVRMVHQLEAHRRHANEIGDPLALDQPQRLTRIPFGHQHHAAPDDEAVEHHRHLTGDMEQRNGDQRARRIDWRTSFRFEDAAQRQQADCIGIDTGRHSAVRGQCTLCLASRARREQDRRVVLGRNVGQGDVVVCRIEPIGEGSFQGLFDGDSFNRIAALCRGQALRARRVGQDQLGLGQGQRV